METTLTRISFHRLADEPLIALLHTEEDRLSREVVDEFVSRGERMIWRLTELCRHEGSWTQGGAAAWAPVHATFILGAFGDTRALMGLLASLRWSALHDFDWVYEKLPSILGRLGRPAIPPLKARVADSETSELDRVTELHALAAIAAHHPVHQGEVLDFVRSLADDPDEDEWIRSVAASVLLKFVRPGDRKTVVASAIRQQWSDRPELFDAQEIEEAYGSARQNLEGYLQDWLGFYAPEAIEARQRRWDEEAEDGQWDRGALGDALWVEEQRRRFLTKYEFSLAELDDDGRGDALWVAESMTEYLVDYEGLAPWRCHGASVFSYLMDFFARRVALDDPGRIQAVPDSLLRFVRFCAAQGRVGAEDLAQAEACIAAEREEFLGAALDPERRRIARAILEQLLASGIDPRDPGAPPAPGAPAPVRERKTSRRIRKK